MFSKQTVKTLAPVSALAVGSLGSAAQVMVENHLNGTALADVYVDGQRVARSLFPADVTFFPVTVVSGAHMVTFLRAGTSPQDASAVLATTATPLMFTVTSGLLKLKTGGGIALTTSSDQ